VAKNNLKVVVLGSCHDLVYTLIIQVRASQFPRRWSLRVGMRRKKGCQ
jgi:hypothetical protein